jgi:hypothetical protein
MWVLVDSWLLACLQGVAEFLMGIYLADLLSGHSHLIIDNLLLTNEELSKVVCKTVPEALEFMKTSEIFLKASGLEQFVWDFQNHHEAPYPGTKGDLGLWLELAKLEAIPALVIIILGYFQVLPIAVVRTLLIMFALATFTSIFHFRAHARNRNIPMSPVFLKLQDWGFIIHPDYHRKHHETFDCNYCIFNGWSNPLVQCTAVACIKLGLHTDESVTAIRRSIDGYGCRSEREPTDLPVVLGSPEASWGPEGKPIDTHSDGSTEGKPIDIHSDGSTDVSQSGPACPDRTEDVEVALAPGSMGQREPMPTRLQNACLAPALIVSVFLVETTVCLVSLRVLLKGLEIAFDVSE